MIIIIWGFYILTISYSIVDYIQTKMLLSVGAIEVNPLLNWLIIKTGTVESILIYKLIWLSLLGILLIILTKEVYKNKGRE